MPFLHLLVLYSLVDFDPSPCDETERHALSSYQILYYHRLFFLLSVPYFTVLELCSNYASSAAILFGFKA